MLNAMTVDLEDWGQSVLDPRLPVTDRVVGNLDRVLALLDELSVKATFFALGKVCEKFPQLLPAIAKAGHEIASHGYGHELVYRQSPRDFREDLARSIAIIEDQTGQRPAGYRAPAFSITSRCPWAPAILEQLGFRYSSSIFPIPGRRYGLPNAPASPFRWPGCRLMEFPLTTVEMLGRRWPACGGGYTRLLPSPVLEAILRHVNRQGRPAVIYLHPYELAVGEVASFRRDGVPVHWLRHLTQELWRGRVADRLRRLLTAAPFGTISDALAETPILRAEPATPRAPARPATPTTALDT